VALFVDPDEAQIHAARDCRAPVIELHTGAYAEAQDAVVQARELGRIRAAADCGARFGLHVNAGHGLNYQNTGAVARIALLRELNIGHGIVAESILSGMQAAVQRMKTLLREARAA
jgi:pyridoxine 5-phosphate synthase